jgi:hypothetical protein
MGGTKDANWLEDFVRRDQGMKPQGPSPALRSGRDDKGSEATSLEISAGGWRELGATPATRQDAGAVKRA